MQLGVEVEGCGDPKIGKVVPLRCATITGNSHREILPGDVILKRENTQ